MTFRSLCAVSSCISLPALAHHAEDSYLTMSSFTIIVVLSVMATITGWCWRRYQNAQRDK